MFMTISKAIDILSDFIKLGDPGDTPDLDCALKLSIQALKRIDRQRKLAIPIHQPPLPGETIV